MPQPTVHRNWVAPIAKAIDVEPEKPTAAKPETKKRRAKKES